LFNIITRLFYWVILTLIAFSKGVQMSKSIHGHQVMQMMADSGKTYTRSELQLQIALNFGADARFHTCMDSDLSSADLVGFLTAKGKFVESEQGISLATEDLC
jgi:probable metal-binding protein